MAVDTPRIDQILSDPMETMEKILCQASQLLGSDEVAPLIAGAITYPLTAASLLMHQDAERIAIALENIAESLSNIVMNGVTTTKGF